MEEGFLLFLESFLLKINFSAMSPLCQYLDEFIDPLFVGVIVGAKWAVVTSNGARLRQYIRLVRRNNVYQNNMIKNLENKV